MIVKKRAVKWTVVFFAVVIICTFFSKTIYYFTLPKVLVENPRSGSFTEAVTLSDGTLSIKGAVRICLELPVPIEIVDVFARRGQAVSAGDNILQFSTEDIKKQIAQLEKQRESAEIALLDFMHGFNSRVSALRRQIPAGAEDGFVDVISASGGIITDISVRKGERVAAGTKLCEISDNSGLILKVPFLASHDIRPGMKAEVSIPSAMALLSGSVKEIGGQVTLYGSKARIVTIELDNPGNIEAGDSAVCTIEGGITPLEDGKLEYKTSALVYAEVSGYVSELNVRQYESVTEGKVLMKIAVSDLGSAKDELDFMLTTGIYNGKTERQLRSVLEEITNAIEQLTVLEETGLIKAESDGIITSLPVSRNMKFAGGTLYEYVTEHVKFEVVFASGDMADIEENLKCTINYNIGGRQYKANGKVTEVGFGYVVAELTQVNERAMQAQGFTAEIVLSEIHAPMTIPTSAMIGSNRVYIITPKETILGRQYIATLREVTTGQKDAYRIEITGGLSQDDKVIVSWDREIEDGKAVDIVTGSKP